MYQVDKREVLSVRLTKERVDTNYVYREEVKRLFKKNEPAGFYLKESGCRLSFIEDVGQGCISIQPTVQVVFKDLNRWSESFFFKSDAEAVEFFNKMTEPDKTLQR